MSKIPSEASNLKRTCVLSRALIQMHCQSGSSRCEAGAFFCFMPEQEHVVWQRDMPGMCDGQVRTVNIEGSAWSKATCSTNVSLLSEFPSLIQRLQTRQHTE